MCKNHAGQKSGKKRSTSVHRKQRPILKPRMRIANSTFSKQPKTGVKVSKEQELQYVKYNYRPQM